MIVLLCIAYDSAGIVLSWSCLGSDLLDDVIGYELFACEYQDRPSHVNNWKYVSSSLLSILSHGLSCIEVEQLQSFTSFAI